MQNGADDCCHESESTRSPSGHADVQDIMELDDESLLAEIAANDPLPYRRKVSADRLAALQAEAAIGWESGKRTRRKRLILVVAICVPLLSVTGYIVSRPSGPRETYLREVNQNMDNLNQALSKLIKAGKTSWQRGEGDVNVFQEGWAVHSQAERLWKRMSAIPLSVKLDSVDGFDSWSLRMRRDFEARRRVALRHLATIVKTEEDGTGSYTTPYGAVVRKSDDGLLEVWLAGEGIRIEYLLSVDIDTWVDACSPGLTDEKPTILFGSKNTRE